MLLYPINHLEHSALRDRWGGRSLSFFSGTMRTGGYDDEERQEAVQTERTLVEQTAIEQPKANVKYKDTIFRMLFSEPEHLLSLYNAATGKDYGIRTR